MSSKISPKNQKILCLRSGNRCAFPGCNITLTLNSSKNEDASIIGAIAHIKGEKPNTARYDLNMTNKERNSYNNLILLCNNHHKLVDDQASTYTVETLQKIKRDHEQYVNESMEKEIINVSFAELNVITKYLGSGQFNTADTYTIIPPREKIKKNDLSDKIEHFITMGLTGVNQVEHYINNCPDIEFGERLKQGFVNEYQKLKNTDGLTGDDLFFALLDFAAAGSIDFKIKAAGLTLLVYLFEKCEVFEK